jgi:hypothetical protein
MKRDALWFALLLLLLVAHTASAAPTTAVLTVEGMT